MRLVLCHLRIMLQLSSSSKDWNLSALLEIWKQLNVRCLTGFWIRLCASLWNKLLLINYQIFTLKIILLKASYLYLQICKKSPTKHKISKKIKSSLQVIYGVVLKLNNVFNRIKAPDPMKMSLESKISKC